MQGVIKASQSLYSSPFILVKKKDNTWRIFVYYRQLNDVTIINKYPVPIIKELLE